MRQTQCEYEAPARFDDEIEVFIRTADDRPHLVAQGVRRAPVRIGRPARARRAGDGADRPRRASADARARRTGATRWRPSRAAREHRRAACRRSSTAARRPTRSCARRSTAVHEAAGAPWSAIAFVEEGEMVVGPLLGAAPDGTPVPALTVPIVYRGDTVAGALVRERDVHASSTPTSRAWRPCSLPTASSAGTPAARAGSRRARRRAASAGACAPPSRRAGAPRSGVRDRPDR